MPTEATEATETTEATEATEAYAHEYLIFLRKAITHNCKVLTTNYNGDHNGGDDFDNDLTKF